MRDKINNMLFNDNCNIICNSLFDKYTIHLLHVNVPLKSLINLHI